MIELENENSLDEKGKEDIKVFFNLTLGSFNFDVLKNLNSLYGYSNEDFLKIILSWYFREHFHPIFDFNESFQSIIKDVRHNNSDNNETSFKFSISNDCISSIEDYCKEANLSKNNGKE
ncbi:MAG: hypothetical protein GF364_14565 [Candidatus Lokiarchaeota archaeon]|nr:hypothetical protein [Candidatus Lokiarchaeota archaeon]